jgi:hypothetical protein
MSTARRVIQMKALVGVFLVVPLSGPASFPKVGRSPALGHRREGHRTEESFRAGSCQTPLKAWHFAGRVYI